MKYFPLLVVAAWLTGCIEDRQSGGPNTQGIIETGYLTCGPAADGCDGALTCADDAGNTACVEAEAETCSGRTACACEGAWVCGERDCLNTENGFECLAPQANQEACRIEDCDGRYGVGLQCPEPGQSRTRRGCERTPGGWCEWIYSQCVEDVVVNCESQECGPQPAINIVCDNGRSPDARCDANEQNECEWTILECADRRPVDRDLTLNPCEPVELPNDPYAIRSAELEGDTLFVGVEYSGGCSEHDFVACPSDFREAVPLQMVLNLSHDSQGDTCEAIRSEVIAIDIAHIRRQHLAQYGEANGRVSVTVQGPEGEQTVLYEF